MNSNLKYPINVLEEAINYFEGEPLAVKFPNGLTVEQTNGILYVINRLQSRYRELITGHYRDGKSIKILAEETAVSKARLYQLLHLAYSDMLSEGNFKFILQGVSDLYINGDTVTPIRDTGVSGRVSNALGRANIHTIADLLQYFEEHTMADFMKIRCMGTVNYAELHEALLNYDIDLDKYGESAQWRK